MNIHQHDGAAVLQSLGSSAAGLSPTEATRRLQEYGHNRVEGVKREPLWLKFFRELTHFFALIMWLAAALAFVAEWRAPGEGMAKVGIALVCVIVVSALFSFWQEFRVERSLAALQKLLPATVKVLRDGNVMQLPAELLVPGDVIHLEAGDNIPADCRVLEAFALGVSNATITGESAVQQRDAIASTADDILRASNILLAGTEVTIGQCKAVVFATGMHTEFGKIAHLTETSGEEASPLRKEIAHMSRVIAVMAISLGGVFFFAGRLVGVPLWQAAIFAIGIIVAMVPEGLLPTLTLALVLAAQRMVKRNVLIRHLPAIETLGSTTVICTDKTGTLTENRMVVQTLWLGEHALTVDDAIKNKNIVSQYCEFFYCAALCHDLHRSSDQHWLGDPMEVSLHTMAQPLLLDNDFVRLQEIPFDGERMRVSVVVQNNLNKQAMLYCKGAPEKLLPLCNRLLVDGEIVEFTPQLQKRVQQAQQTMAEKGLRVLGFSCKPVAINAAGLIEESELIFCGLAGLEDPARAEVPEAIRKCHAAGIRVIMITGDHPATAKAIANKIGLFRGDKPLVITGDQLLHFSRAQLHYALEHEDLLFARVAAEQKLQIVQALKDKKHIVAVTGDGVNDAPALKSAHIGIAMGRGGTDVARAAADMVLLDDNFASIVNGIEEGRAVFENIRKFLTYILAHNVPELVPYLAFVLLPVPLALTPIQILAIDMGADSLTALGLGTEKPDPATMQKPPRPITERLMNIPLALRAYLFLGLMEAAVAMSAFFFVLLRGGWHYGEKIASSSPLYMQATTACLSAIIVLQIINVFLCRSNTRSIFSTGLRGNPLILWGVALEVALLVLLNYTSLGNTLLDTVALPWPVWQFILPFTFAMLALEELRKWWVRLRSEKQS
jgi:calcium-translocating P-type ATPase